MAYPNTTDETPTFVDGWNPANDKSAAAEIWKVTKDGRLVRYEADYYKDGRKIMTFTGSSIASLIRQLGAKYGPARK